MQRVLSGLTKILEALIGAMFLVVVLITAAQVFCRYALGFSLPWSHEAAILLIIWIVWLAMPVGLRRMEHLSVTIVVERLPDAPRQVVEIVNLVLCALFFALVFALSFPVIEAFEGMNLLTLPIPIYVRYVAATVGSLLSVVMVVGGLFRAARGA